MARPRQTSIVQIPPRVKGFIPFAYYGKVREPIKLNLEEYEAIRLLDYEDLSQTQAAEFMDISRPTLTRIYDRARKKMALVLTEAHQLLIEGGKALLEGEWYECSKCRCRFNNPQSKPVAACIVCDNPDVTRLNSCMQ
ncbi:MAG: DUF134 domain-containing protein [Bacteroidales bacterium]|nr:DUF134 domain-containing protein [Bacteroidales bacterium]